MATVAYIMRVLYNIRLSDDANKTTTTTTTRVKECIQGGVAEGEVASPRQNYLLGSTFLGDATPRASRVKFCGFPTSDTSKHLAD